MFDEVRKNCAKIQKMQRNILPWQQPKSEDSDNFSQTNWKKCYCQQWKYDFLEQA